MSGWALTFDPLFPGWLLAAFAALALVLVGFSVLARARGVWARAALLSVLLLVFANPQMLHESRTPLRDIAVAVVDRSPSNRLEDRAGQADEALAALRRGMRESGGELRVVETERDAARSDILGPLSEALSGVPQERLSAAVIVSDGRVDDADRAAAIRALERPVHALLTGSRGMKDRRIEVLRAPEFGVVDKPVTLRLQVVEENFEADGPVALTIRRQGGDPEVRSVSPGEPVEITLTPRRRGEMVIDVAVEAAEGEPVTVNNRRLFSINAVRDRLRVLLISGEPHPGERVWRATLKSDPAVDLIHFTILRLPTSQDPTPVSQLSLIPFPTERLFAEQLDDFDLVIFDRYSLRGVLELRYFDNLLAYVREGGAVLVANGPEFAAEASLYRTPLSEILPAEPTGEVLEEGYAPLLTETGRRHPVTAPLAALVGKEGPRWGRWFRLVGSRIRTGTVLMEVNDALPLLVLAEVGQGRIAQLMSDHVWLWSRGIEGGGPYQELLRRSVHWLMKEPDLEAETLEARAESGDLVIKRRSLEAGEREVQVSGPNGYERTVTLSLGESGVAQRSLDVPEFGLYRVREDELSAVAAVGPTGGRELANVVPTASLLAPLPEETGGGVYWLEEGMPDIRRPSARASAAGAGWLGLPRREAARVDSVEQAPLLPAWAWALLLGGLMAVAWWRESR